MKYKLFVFSAGAVGLLLISSPMLAHHGAAMYDLQHVTILKGTVTEFAFVNPHVEIYFDVKDEKGNIEKWTAETSSPNMLHRAGWNKTTLKPGDQVTVSGNRAKDGSKTMFLAKIATSDGREIIPRINYD